MHTFSGRYRRLFKSVVFWKTGDLNSHHTSFFGGSSNIALLSKLLKTMDGPLKKKLIFVTLVGVVTSGLDMVGIIILANLARIFSSDEFSNISDAGAKVPIAGLRFEIEHILVLSLLLFVTKTFLSIFLTRTTFHSFAVINSSLNKRLIPSVFNKMNVEELSGKSSQEVLTLITSGLSAIVLTYFGSLSALIVDSFLIMLILFSLFWIDKAVLGVSVILLFCAFVGIFFFTSNRSRYLGGESLKYFNSSNLRFIEAIKLLPELTLSGSFDRFLDKGINDREKLIKANSELEFISILPRYLMDLLLVLGVCSVGTFGYLVNGWESAAISVAIFLLSFSRVLPATLRAQALAIRIKSNIILINETLLFLDSNEYSDLQPDKTEVISESSQNSLNKGDRASMPIVKLDNVVFAFKGNSKQSLFEVNLELHQRQICVLKGTSGVGKSTLLRILNGDLLPTKGVVKIFDSNPREFIRANPGIVALVPQSPILILGTILENISLMREPLSPSQFKDLMKKTSLNKLISIEGRNKDDRVIEAGNNLSGGEKQRIALARAIWSNPELLLLDEPTSALDKTTSKELISTLLKLRSECTLIISTHDKDLIDIADVVVDLDSTRRC